MRVWALSDSDSGVGRGAARALRGHGGAVLAVLATAATRRLVSASADRTLRVWAVASGACLQSVQVVSGGPGSGGVVQCLTLWGGYVVGGCQDGAVLTWDVETLEVAVEGPTRASHGEPVRSVAADAEDGGLWCAVGRGLEVWRRVGQMNRSNYSMTSP